LASISKASRITCVRNEPAPRSATRLTTAYAATGADVLTLISGLLAEETTAPQRPRVAIGWTDHGLPRTYRLVRRRRWPVRAFAALRTRVG
jgi:hypothetical protein